MKDIVNLARACNSCPHCNGSGKIPHPSVGFKLAVGDIVEDHVGERIRIDHVSSTDETLGWGTSMNSLGWAGGHRNNIRVETDNDIYTESLWTKISP